MIEREPNAVLDLESKTKKIRKIYNLKGKKFFLQICHRSDLKICLGSLLHCVVTFDQEKKIFQHSNKLMDFLEFSGCIETDTVDPKP